MKTRLRTLLFLAAALPLPGLGCDYPDEGNMPLRRALTRVQARADVQAWDREQRAAGAFVEYRLLLDETRQIRGKCHWTVEALSGGTVWRRFLVTPDGRSVVPAVR